MSAAGQEQQRRLRDAVRQFLRAALGVRVPFRDRWRYWCYYVGLARRGVLQHSATRDAVYADGFWKRGYEKYRARIDARLAQAGPERIVEVLSFAHGELKLADLRFLMRANVPFVIRGGAASLPMRAWTLDYLNAVAGDCPVPINEAKDQPAADTTRPTKSHHYYDFRTGTLGEVVDAIRAGGHMRITTAEDVMHHAGGRLRHDLDLPYWERVSGWDVNQHRWLGKRLLVGKIVGAQLLLQPQNAITLWHAEPGDNFFVLGHGVKDWSMAHPYYTAAMRPRVKSTTNYTGSNIDVRESEAVQRQRGFAGYLGVPKVRFTMQPGDMLRVPNHWWHTVVTRPGDYTVAATIRSNSPPNRVGFGFVVLRLLDGQFHELARSYAKEGRIHDRHIGYPRRPRASDESA